MEMVNWALLREQLKQVILKGEEEGGRDEEEESLDLSTMFDETNWRRNCAGASANAALCVAASASVVLWEEDNKEACYAFSLSPFGNLRF